MNYDLAVWLGERPANDAVGLLTYLDLYERYIDKQRMVPLTRHIAMYAAALSAGLRSIEPGRHSWSDNALLKKASGPFIYLSFSCGGSDDVVLFAGSLAVRHGLVCFDPQQECRWPMQLHGDEGGRELRM